MHNYAIPEDTIQFNWFPWASVVIAQASSLIVNIVIFTHGPEQIWGVACESNMRSDANLTPHSNSMNPR